MPGSSRKRNPVEPLVDRFSKTWKSHGEKLSANIKLRIKRGQSPRAAVRIATKKLKIDKIMEKSLLDTIEESIGKGGLSVIPNQSLQFREWYLHQHWPGDQFTLSQRIARSKYKSIIREEILSQMKQNRTINQTAKALTDKQLITGDVSNTINELNRLSRRVAIGDMTAQRSYKTALNKARRNVQHLAAQTASQTSLKKAYANIIRASERLSVEQLDRAIDRAVLRKARYNAERIVRTEAARAYGVATQQSALDDPDVKALRWELNPSHQIYDICDFHTEADLYGLGKGVYPTDAFPDYPAHPHCLCIIDEVYRLKQKRPLTPETQLNRLNAHQQKKLMGVEGRQEFLKNPASWRKNLKNYNGAPEHHSRVPPRFIKQTPKAETR